jgi:hypothetical protein
MALHRVNLAGADFQFGIPSGTSVDGVDSLTSFEATREYETSQTARNEVGEVVAHLFGNERHALQGEGYTNAASVPALGTDVAGEGTMTMLGLVGKVTRCVCRGSNEDFVRVQTSGEGYAALASEY